MGSNGLPKPSRCWLPGSKKLRRDPKAVGLYAEAAECFAPSDPAAAVAAVTLARHLRANEGWPPDDEVEALAAPLGATDVLIDTPPDVEPLLSACRRSMDSGRETGTVARTVEDRGFGFITPAAGEDDIFFTTKVDQPRINLTLRTTRGEWSSNPSTDDVAHRDDGKAPADLYDVAAGTAEAEYQDPAQFFVPSQQPGTAEIDWATVRVPTTRATSVPGSARSSPPRRSSSPATAASG